MGVPITFLHKLNTDQFEIVGLMTCGDNIDWTRKDKIDKLRNGKKIGSSQLNVQPYFKIDKPPVDKTYYQSSDGQLWTAIYARLLIKRKI